MLREFGYHLTEDFNVLIIDFFEKFVYTRLENLRFEHIVLVQFHDQSHVSEHL